MRVWRTLDHYVDAARAQEDFSAVAAVGLDETAARRGHHYISLFHDLEAARLLFACEGRKATVVDEFAEDLEAHGGCAENVRNVCIDMSASYRAGIAETLPWADVTFDEFHVIQLVNKAVDEVRRQEAKSTPEPQAHPLPVAEGQARLDRAADRPVRRSQAAQPQDPPRLPNQGGPARDLPHRQQRRRGRAAARAAGIAGPGAAGSSR